MTREERRQNPHHREKHQKFLEERQKFPAEQERPDCRRNTVVREEEQCCKSREEQQQSLHHREKRRKFREERQKFLEEQERQDCLLQGSQLGSLLACLQEHLKKEKLKFFFFSKRRIFAGVT